MRFTVYGLGFRGRGWGGGERERKRERERADRNGARYAVEAFAAFRARLTGAIASASNTGYEPRNIISTGYETRNITQSALACKTNLVNPRAL